jgi:RHS repeat-associated protein
VLDQDRDHNKANEVTDITEQQGDPVWPTPTHDAAGNITTVPRPNSPTTALTLKYDGWNRLVEVKQGQEVHGSNEFDGLGRRTIEMPDYGETTYWMHKYWNSSWQLLEQRQNTNDDPPESSSVVRRFVWSARYIDAPVLQYYYAAKHYLLGDGNFNVSSVINTSGEALEHYQYDPYGKLTVLNGGTPDGDGAEWTADPNNATDVANVYLYTGRSRDFQTHLYDYRNRPYSAELGRFLSRDPLEADINLYRYVGNNPVLYADPTGNKKCEITSGTICATTTDAFWEKKEIPDPRDKSKKITSYRLTGEHAVRYIFKEGGDCSCDCCAIEQWIKGYYHLKLPNGAIIEGGSKLPGSGKPIDPKEYRQDSPRIGAKISNKQCIADLLDAPGIGVTSAARNYPGLEVDVNLSFEIRVIDTCNDNKVIETKTHTMSITGPLSKPVLKTSLPKCTDQFLKDIKWPGLPK